MSSESPEFLSFDEIAQALGSEWSSVPRAHPTGVATDTREAMQGKLFIALRGDRFDAHDFLDAAFAQGASGTIIEQSRVAQSRVAGPTLAVENTRRALAELARAWRSKLTDLTVAAVTGSAGKTTTRRLIEAACATVGKTCASVKSFNNDIGVPLTMFAARKSHAFLVAEIGMNHPGEILPLARIVSPHVAVVTMAGRAHLEGMGSMEAVAEEKASIFSALSDGGCAVLPSDAGPLTDAIERLALPRRGVRVIRFGSEAHAEVRLLSRAPATEAKQRVRLQIAASLCTAEQSAQVVEFDCALPGAHNARNAAAAIAAALALGVDLDAAIRGVEAVVPSEMRFVREDRRGVTFFNDTYNANPDAMLAALRTFAELAARAPRRVAFLGEMRELGANAAGLHREIGREAATTGLDAMIAVGPFACEVKDAYEQEGGRGTALAFEEFGSDAMEAALRHATPGTSVLVKGSRGARMERFLAEFR